MGEIGNYEEQRKDTMKDISFGASLDGAKLLAHNQEAKVVRRAEFKLGRNFDLEQAEWLDAEPLRQKLQRGELDAFEIPIDAYHAKASFHGLAGNATAQVDGVWPGGCCGGKTGGPAAR